MTLLLCYSERLSFDLQHELIDYSTTCHQKKYSLGITIFLDKPSFDKLSQDTIASKNEE